MDPLLRTIALRGLLAEQVPALAMAWLLAEMFHRFHSFSLACAAFLLTWFVLDAWIQGLRRLFAPARARAAIER